MWEVSRDQNGGYIIEPERVKRRRPPPAPKEACGYKRQKSLYGVKELRVITMNVYPVIPVCVYNKRDTRICVL